MSGDGKIPTLAPPPARTPSERIARARKQQQQQQQQQKQQQQQTARRIKKKKKQLRQEQEGLVKGDYVPSRKTLGLELIASPDLLSKNDTWREDDDDENVVANNGADERKAKGQQSDGGGSAVAVAASAAPAAVDQELNSSSSSGGGLKAEQHQQHKATAARPESKPAPTASSRGSRSTPRLRRLGVSMRDTAPKNNNADEKQEQDEDDAHQTKSREEESTSFSPSSTLPKIRRLGASTRDTPSKKAQASSRPTSATITSATAAIVTSSVQARLSKQKRMQTQFQNRQVERNVNVKQTTTRQQEKTEEEELDEAVLGLGASSSISRDQERVTENGVPAAVSRDLFDGLDKPFSDEDYQVNNSSDSQQEKDNNDTTQSTAAKGGKEKASKRESAAAANNPNQASSSSSIPPSQDTKDFLKTKGIESIRAARAGRVASIFSAATSRRRKKDTFKKDASCSVATPVVERKKESEQDVEPAAAPADPDVSADTTNSGSSSASKKNDVPTTTLPSRGASFRVDSPFDEEMMAEKQQLFSQQLTSSAHPSSNNIVYSKKLLPSPAVIRDRRAKRTVQERLKLQAEEQEKRCQPQIEQQRVTFQEHVAVAASSASNSIIASDTGSVLAASHRRTKSAGSISTNVSNATPKNTNAMNRASPTPSPTLRDPTMRDYFCTPTVSSSQIHENCPVVKGGMVVGGTSQMLLASSSSVEQQSSDGSLAATMKREISHESPTGVEELTLSQHEQVVKRGSRSSSGVGTTNDSDEMNVSKDSSNNQDLSGDGEKGDGNDDDQTWNSEDTEKTNNTYTTLERQASFRKQASVAASLEKRQKSKSDDDAAVGQPVNTTADDVNVSMAKKKECTNFASLSYEPIKKKGIEVVVDSDQEKATNCTPCSAIICSHESPTGIEMVDEITKWLMPCWGDNGSNRNNNHDEEEDEYDSEDEEEGESRMEERLRRRREIEEEEESVVSSKKSNEVKRPLFNATWDGSPAVVELNDQEKKNVVAKNGGEVVDNEAVAAVIAESIEGHSSSDGQRSASLFDPSWDKIESPMNNSMLDEGYEAKDREEAAAAEISSLSTSNVELELIGVDQNNLNIVLQSKHKTSRKRSSKEGSSVASSQCSGSLAAVSVYSSGMSVEAASVHSNAMSIDELLEKDRQLAERKELDNGDDIDDANDDDDNSSPNSRLSYSSLSMEARELLRSIADQKASTMLDSPNNVEEGEEEGVEEKDACSAPPKIQREIQPIELFKDGHQQQGEENTEEEDDVFVAQISEVRRTFINEESSNGNNSTIGDNNDDDNSTLDEDDDTLTLDSIDNSTLTSRETKGSSKVTVLAQQQPLGCHSNEETLALLHAQNAGCAGFNPMPSWFNGINGVLDVMDKLDDVINGQFNGRAEEESDEEYDDDDNDAQTIEDDNSELSDLYRRRRSKNSRLYNKGISGTSSGDNNNPDAPNSNSRRSLQERSRDRHRKRRDKIARRQQYRHNNRRTNNQQDYGSSSPLTNVGGGEGGDDTDAIADVNANNNQDEQRAYQVRFSPGTIVEEETDGEENNNAAAGNELDGTSAAPGHAASANNASGGEVNVDNLKGEEDSFDNVHKLQNYPPKQSKNQARTFNFQSEENSKTDSNSSMMGAKRMDRISRPLTHKKRSFPRLKREWSVKSGGTVTVDGSAKSSP